MNPDDRPADPPLEILYDQGSCLAVNKPAGVLTQAPPGIDSMEERVRRLWQAQAGKTHRLYVGVPHRLDRPVSGVLLFTRNIRATQRLGRQFEHRAVEKVYLALVEGRPPDTGAWSDWLWKVPGRAWVELVAPDHPAAQAAQLSYETLAPLGDVTLIAVRPATGRTHQIRVQSAHRGYPILGDDQYGSRRAFGRAWSDPRERSIALHARSLRFRHPTLARDVHLRAPLSADWLSEQPTAAAVVEAWEHRHADPSV